MKKLLNLSILISPLSVIWDIATGWHRWSIDFVLPCTYLTVMLAITVISRITRMPAERYLIYLIFLLLFGLIPAVFLRPNGIGCGCRPSSASRAAAAFFGASRF